MVLTDYDAVSKLLLAYPERFYNGYDELVPFYDELLSLIPNDFETWVITNNNQSIKKLEEKFSHKKMSFLGLKGWDDIWLRDCLGIVKGDKVIKPEYSPNYCESGNNREYFKKINGLSRIIIKECLNKEIIPLNLKLDGGNFICNNDLVFITDKILEQNGIYSQKEISINLIESLSLRPIIIERNKCDVIGHTDAYINFIDEKRALISSYPPFPFLKDDIDFLNHLDEKLKAEGIERITFYDRPIDEGAHCLCKRKSGKPCFYSARGNYINFLRINNLIILPEYNLSTKRESDFYNKKNQEVLESLGFEVRRINCDRLAKFGGVLHCISFLA